MGKLTRPTPTAMAHHEAGHAIASITLGMPFEYVTILPGEETCAHCQGDDGPLWEMRPTTDGHGRDHPRWAHDPDEQARASVERRAFVVLAGDEAESWATGKHPYFREPQGASQDAAERFALWQCLEAVGHYQDRWAEGDDMYTVVDEIRLVTPEDFEAAMYLRCLYLRTRRLLQRESIRAPVEAVAATLLQRKRLSCSEVVRVATEALDASTRRRAGPEAA
jgi:hypothetical protein